MKPNWLVVWNMNFICPFSWEFHHPNWRTPSFFRGVGLNHQPANEIGPSPVTNITCGEPFELPDDWWIRNAKFFWPVFGPDVLTDFPTFPNFRHKQNMGHELYHFLWVFIPKIILQKPPKHPKTCPMGKATWPSKSVSNKSAGLPSWCVVNRPI